VGKYVSEKYWQTTNLAARIFTGTKKYYHITPVLQQLNWLPVSYMLQYKDTVMAYKCLKGLAPPYLARRFTSGADLGVIRAITRLR
jgi:hypothetical protein